MLDLWYKNAIIYCLDVETFMDSNGDGVGDFQGVTDRLEHLEAMGVTAIWLNPFYPSGKKDNGYDITDFYGVDPRFGSPGDFVVFTRACADRGIKVLIDLVVHHTSNEHPWFKSACSDPQSPYRDWYVWSKEKPEDITEGIIFPGVQKAVWTWDKTARSWYMHRFYKFQPDLNIANPAVIEEIQRIVGYWLELGVSGFRIDAAPYLVEYKGLKEEPPRDPLQLFGQLHDFLSWRRAEAVMLAEANIDRPKTPKYFGGFEFDTDERLQMLFDFPLNQAIWLAMARGEAAPILKALDSRPRPAPVMSNWANFIRNHDELSLDKLTPSEREEVFACFGPDKNMQIYERGLRRRLAPMIGPDDGRLALMQSLLFALPGTPVMFYGDEVGMGEDLSMPEREPVRLPMQWAPGDNGGFSKAPKECLVKPVLHDGPFGCDTRSVSAQRDRPGSLLSRVESLVRARRACREIGWGETTPLPDMPPGVLGLMSEWKGTRVITLHNLGHVPVANVPLPLSDKAVQMVGSTEAFTDSPQSIDLQVNDYRWFRDPGLYA